MTSLFTPSVWQRYGLWTPCRMPHLIAVVPNRVGPPRSTHLHSSPRIQWRVTITRPFVPRKCRCYTTWYRTNHLTSSLCLICLPYRPSTCVLASCENHVCLRTHRRSPGLGNRGVLPLRLTWNILSTKPCTTRIDSRLNSIRLLLIVATVVLLAGLSPRMSARMLLPLTPKCPIINTPK